MEAKPRVDNQAAARSIGSIAKLFQLPALNSYFTPSFIVQPSGSGRVLSLTLLFYFTFTFFILNGPLGLFGIGTFFIPLYTDCS